MSKVVFRIGLGLLVITSMVTCDESYNRGDYGTTYETRGYEELIRQQLLKSVASALDTDYTNRGLGISAWGIVILAVSLILAIIVMYYISICYPVVCKKSRKYDKAGLTSAV